ncbi:MAG: LysR family transcriptional regulator [Spirochaetaceae bacterium]|jgi:molybdate transport system regulatory protein|nr:LysR family transcriptional regulator [Spirochaetaceae bacterium]
MDCVEPVVKVFLASPGGRGKPFCGPGMINLLEAIQKTGNVRRACEDMELSYSKGWKLLNSLEAWLMYPVAERRQGGKGGGEARLTEKGADFLKKHRAFETECREAVRVLFDKYYANEKLPATRNGVLNPDSE